MAVFLDAMTIIETIKVVLFGKETGQEE